MFSIRRKVFCECNIRRLQVRKLRKPLLCMNFAYSKCYSSNQLLQVPLPQRSIAKFIATFIMASNWRGPTYSSNKTDCRQNNQQFTKASIKLLLLVVRSYSFVSFVDTRLGRQSSCPASETRTWPAKWSHPDPIPIPVVYLRSFVWKYLSNSNG